ncbi:hypothetical protein QBC37DRAFT_448381 [Rhypophila decipiens]|uniref:Uncharacterized protein n=1 Tax=Rhypophila decipiens TaxID=261697 RepID=A0AAN7B554_9PEZI|nr:hypothetical protein QBC37DRAFT_448381 [Rhypophila decipiens]
MSGSSKAQSTMELASKGMDLTARAIDLVVTLADLGHGGKSVGFWGREILRWLGKECLHENELAFFLSKSQSLVMPNDEKKVVHFFQAVTGDRSSSQTSSATPAMVPLCAQPFASIGKLVARDPTQRWMISTICCLLRYHDESYIKAFLAWFLIMGDTEVEGRARLSRYDMSRLPEKFRLEAVVKKVVESAWLHIANAGLLGTTAECPRLPSPEFDWTCKNGHNLDDYQFAKLTYEVSQSTSRGGELIIQSQYLLTDVVLWLLWHHHGRLRVVVSSKVIYDNTTSLGPDCESLRIVECRVAKACDKEGWCRDSSARKEKLFQVFENIAGHLNLLFKAAYNRRETSRGGIFVRQELYEWPHNYPNKERTTKERSAGVAKYLLRWYLELPLPSCPPINHRTGPEFQLRLGERQHKGQHVDTTTVRVGDLLGRSPMFLNDNRGSSESMEKSKVVFAIPREDPDEGSRDPELRGLEYQMNSILPFFPILQDLVEDQRKRCLCLRCWDHQKATRTPSKKSGGSRVSRSTLYYDKNCLSFLAFHEVLFYFSHAIADAFGAPDASGTPSFAEALEGDLGALDILDDAVTIESVSKAGPDGKLIEGSRGWVKWSTLFRTASRVFLGNKAGDLLARQEEQATWFGGSEKHTDLRDPWNLRGSPIIAAQYGALAVVAPWIDISQHLSRKRSFRFDIVQGKLGLYRGSDEMNHGQHIHEMATSNDLCVVMTPRTEDVTKFGAKEERRVHEAGAVLTFERDKSEEQWSWVLVPVDETKKMLLLRVVSGQHSRMVDPSNALGQLFSSVKLPTCTHRGQPVNRNIVPENCQVELHGFDQLLGHWGDEDSDGETDYDSSDEDFSDSDDDHHSGASEQDHLNDNDEMELENDNIDQTHSDDDESSTQNSPELLLHASSTGRRTKEVPEKYEIPASEVPRLQALSRIFHFRTSHTLTSAFKFNTALAISNDYTCFVAPDGNSCLVCALSTAVETRRVSTCGRRFYIVNRAESLVTTSPLLLQDDRMNTSLQPSSQTPVYCHDLQ